MSSFDNVLILDFILNTLKEMLLPIKLACVNILFSFFISIFDIDILYEVSTLTSLAFILYVYIVPSLIPVSLEKVRVSVPDLVNPLPTVSLVIGNVLGVFNLNDISFNVSELGVQVSSTIVLKAILQVNSSSKFIFISPFGAVQVCLTSSSLLQSTSAFTP